ncbi:rust resistance kinase Lr10-like [Neltuma alba]|uniref:rust resistance kinase Lr10-like n=1 Tax=Neltuma alba TaxID=207710 RepID=UPI0010A42D5D|nr:rust resistance kinase Lr10-like [Prosopis alba]
MAVVLEFCFLLVSHLLLLSVGYGNASHIKCLGSFNCGELGSLQLPFTKPELPDCGLMVVHNCDASDKPIELEKNGSRSFLQLKAVFLQQSLITVFDQDLHNRLQSNGSCEAFNHNISIPASSPLISFDIKYNITLFKCNHQLNVSTPSGFIKHPCANFDIYHYRLLSDPQPRNKSHFSSCSNLVLPKKDLPDTTDLQSFLSAQMTLELRISDACDQCHSSGGQCQLDRNNNFYCARGVLAAVTVGVFVLIIYLFRRTLFRKNKSKTHRDFEAFLKSHGSLATKRYSYSEIKKMTSCFKEKLGQGGYGSVFKGKLTDKSLVAVKVLNETKGNREEFINEVASISKTSHVNIVTLLGFCFEGSKKALIYEFMANGSLEKFIFENEANLLNDNLQLSCEILHQIAVSVARGLEYLHKGYFGLAKICLRNESVVSMTCARGTIGYIAPEVISRNFGVVSHKSDVYSFGMMILEMVGGRRNVNVNVDNSSEIYFPHWIYKRLELNEELALRSIGNEGDKERIRQMVITSLWCIQTNPSDRPMMSKVVEMLEGRVETLQVPPKPYLSSLSASPCHSSSSTH